MQPGKEYSLDNKNRLVIRRGKEEIIPDGRFSTDSRNRLIYWLNEPRAWRARYQLPSKVSFEGNWRIGPDHDLELLLSKSRGKYTSQKLSLKGEIVSSVANAIVFQFLSIDKRGNSHFRLLTLKGNWQADKFNRIVFLVKKSARPDILTLKGAWSLDKNQQIVYTYEKRSLKRKIKVSKALIFRGFWQINSRNRLTYIISKGTGSVLVFRVQIESPNLYPAQGVIKYRLGIGFKRSGIINEQVIYIYGAWKLGKDLALSFEVDYGRYGIEQIEFGSRISLSTRDAIAITLLNKSNEPLGFSLILSRRFLDKYPGKAFLRFKKLAQEKRIDAGLRFEL